MPTEISLLLSVPKVSCIGDTGTPGKTFAATCRMGSSISGVSGEIDARALPSAQDGAPRYEVGVHIADVGHFIKAGTPIDAEAAARATTVYLVNRRIDMVRA